MKRSTFLRSSLALPFFVAVYFTFCAATLSRADDFGKVAAADRIAAKKVVDLIQTQHLLRQAIDDTISQRALERMLKTLDPGKSYFLKSDVEMFESKYRFQLDDDLKAGRFDSAFDIFVRFRDRVDQVTQIVDQWLDVPHDFTVDEEIVTDRKLMDYPTDEAELRERWRLRVKYNLLVFRGENQTKLTPEERLRKRTHAIAKRWHQFDNDDVIELFVSSMTTSFDPHTSYMSKTTFTNFLIQLRLQLEGIGATLQGDDDGYIVVRQVVTGGAAFKQGDLKVEDRIIGVAQGDNGEMIDTVGMKQDDVVQMIRGKAGTVVRLSVLKPNDEIREIRIVRERIELEDQAAKSKIVEEGLKPDGTPWRIGVIELPSFYSDESGVPGGRSSTTDVERLLREFNRQNVDALVLDLRKNGGGSLREAIDLSGLFIDYGPIVQVKNPFNQVQVHRDERRGRSWDKPMVVLTSKFSASASEILAGAIKDWGAGIVVGDSTTHGKGTVQSLVDLNSVFFRN
ncbi:MAG TPA: S41 family peptidase, partial [Pirellulaceae bacterium]|nr:S41 family peptidase [Pirellulaceae bacterium]